MVEKVFLIFVLCVCVLMLVAMGSFIFTCIYYSKHKNDPPTKDEWKILE